MLTDVGAVPVVQSSAGGCGYGDGCGMNSMMGMILIIALLGGGCGFGGIGNRGCRDGYGDGGYGAGYGHIDSRFNNLENMNEMRFLAQQSQGEASRLADNVCATNRNIDNQAFALQTSLKNAEIANLQCCCATQGAIAESKFDNALIAKNAELSALRCCCETNSHIDQVERRITEKLDKNEIQTLRDKLAEVSLAQSQCRQNAELIGSLKPCPVPAYPAWSPYQQVPPFAYGPFNDRRDNGCCCA